MFPCEFCENFNNSFFYTTAPSEQMSSRRLQEMSSRHLQDMPARRIQDISSRRLQDMSSSRIYKTSSRRLEDQQMFAGLILSLVHI